MNPLALIHAILGMPVGLPFKVESKQPKKCLLKDCNNTTFHNGGYCCKEHCLKDRADRRRNEPIHFNP